ncbi:GIY-YIG nuclease family protein [Salibacterium halotolerans]|uniref:Putative endonuclease n=1 Tax=Salibacterium halotolerans TaxID=1884432 RepID=A0A1I5WMZ6_9BACI|nr:GIY-YIG nuclease family protein [Salibacterium halotolerans]SFQ21164.1 putative endonuclease [Salibacterium halotolerans]
MQAAEHHVYILECRDGSYYTGYTTDLVQRLRMHERGKGAKYTRGRGPFRVVYHEVFDKKTDAMRMEYEIKQWTRKEKEMFLADKEGGMS